MALTYNWSVRNIKIKDQVNADGDTLPKAVFQTYWRITATDEDGNEGQWDGATPFSAENVPAGSFVAFEQLTEELVLGWIQNIVNADPSYWAHINEQLQKAIDETKGVAEELEGSALPWAPAEEESEEDAGAVDPEPSEESANT